MVRTGGLHVYRPSKVDLLLETTMVGYIYATLGTFANFSVALNRISTVKQTCRETSKLSCIGNMHLRHVKISLNW